VFKITPDTQFTDFAMGMAATEIEDLLETAASCLTYVKGHSALLRTDFNSFS